MTGGETQVVNTIPLDAEEHANWRVQSVQPTSAATSSTTIMGFGFQLYKEDVPGDDRTHTTANWSCIIGEGQQLWITPDPWYDNRHNRRDVPEGIGTDRFRAVLIRQDLQLSNTTRRMIKTPR